MVALTAGLLALSFTTVYWFEAAGRRRQFTQLLLNNARNRTIIHFEFEGANAGTNPFREYRADVLPNAELYLFTFENELIYPGESAPWRPSKEDVEAVRKNIKTYFSLSDGRDMAGLHMVEEYNGLVAFSVARDDDGLARLKTLQRTLLGVLLLSLPLLWGLAYWYSGRALKPIRNIIRSAKTISSTETTARLTPSGSRDELEELVTAFNDLLQRIEMAFQAQKNLISNASHELRTPLAAMHMRLDILLMKEPDCDTLRNEIHRFKSQVQDLTTTTHHLLMLAEMETRLREGRQPQMRINLADILFKALEPLQNHPEFHNLSWQIDEKLEAEEALSTTGDETLLIIALRNLIENALKYGQSAAVEVLLSRSEQQLTVEVKDNGSGIPKEEQEKIFEPFQRGTHKWRDDANPEDTEKIPGHGLGLPLSARIALLHQGKIELESIPGKGSIFRLILPASVAT
jgi:signal transduction histidine kinase